jgi:hypothetical protein
MQQTDKKKINSLPGGPDERPVILKPVKKDRYQQMQWRNKTQGE